MTDNNTTYLTNLRAVATIMVIVLHVCSFYMDLYSVENALQWQTVNALDSITRVCIGLFLMITGALLLPQKIILKEFLRKRLLRIGLPFIFWTLIYVLIKIFIGKEDVSSTLQNGIYFGAAYHFWYLYMLIGIYLIIPIIAVFVQNASKNLVQYFIILWLISLTTSMFSFKSIFPNFNLIYFSGYLGYVILGYYINTYGKEFKHFKKVTYLILGYLFTFSATFYFTKKSNTLNTDFYQYLDLNVVLMAACLFMIFKFHFNFISKIFELISTYSFGIYFIHPLVLRFMEIKNFMFTSIWIVHVFITSSVILLLSFIVIYLLRKLPKSELFIG